MRTLARALCVCCLIMLPAASLRPDQTLTLTHVTCKSDPRGVTLSCHWENSSGCTYNESIAALKPFACAGGSCIQACDYPLPGCAVTHCCLRTITMDDQCENPTSCVEVPVDK
jgi:hypothetical protein